MGRDIETGLSVGLFDVGTVLTVGDVLRGVMFGFVESVGRLVVGTPMLTFALLGMELGKKSKLGTKIPGGNLPLVSVGFGVGAVVTVISIFVG